MNISLVVGVLMLIIKVGAYFLTGSSAILSDAVESIVHVVAVGFAAFSQQLSNKPADPNHPYGYAKISFFSAGFEGAMIVMAAIFIIYDAIKKWLAGLALENIGFGTSLTLLALLINGILGLYLIRLGKKHGSIIIRANGHHVLTDAWTSLGVIIGLALVWVTGWLHFDPICAILVASNILYSGFGLMKESFVGLMDTVDEKSRNKIEKALRKETDRLNISYHLLRIRNTGSGYWIDFHLVFDDETQLKFAHEKATEIEDNLRDSIGSNTLVTTHLEPAKDHEIIHSHSMNR